MKAAVAIAGTIGEVFGFLLDTKSWWLIPMVAILLLMAVLLILGTAFGVGPFVYSLF